MASFYYFVTTVQISQMVRSEVKLKTYISIMRKGFLVVRYINTKSLIHLLTGGMDNNTNDDN